jgi:hypothetical protein
LLAWPVRHGVEPTDVSPHIMIAGWQGMPVVFTSMILLFRKE